MERKKIISIPLRSIVGTKFKFFFSLYHFLSTVNRKTLIKNEKKRKRERKMIYQNLNTLNEFDA